MTPDFDIDFLVGARLETSNRMAVSPDRFGEGVAHQLGSHVVGH
jgi:hypothetical protein